MTIEAKIIADSVSEASVRITTLQLRYPRFIHAEFMTHRVFSRNASSSRAIPITKLIEDIERDPAGPIVWGSNKPGMQAGAELDSGVKYAAGLCWHAAMMAAVAHAKELAEYGCHKQIVNRILEPFAHINVVVTATEWTNFFALRRHPDAEPTIHALADAIYGAMVDSTPENLTPGHWHLPYADDEGRDLSTPELQLQAVRISAARCARVSYLTHDGRKTADEEDYALADKLLTSKHMSPFEHQATPVHLGARHVRNFVGWRPYRVYCEL